MKRVVILIFTMSLAAFGQLTPKPFSGRDSRPVCGPITNHAQLCVEKKSAHNVLLVYSIRERCPECSYRYAMVCLAGDDCNTPWEQHEYMEWFDDEAAALKFMEEDSARKFIALYRTLVVTVNVDEKTISEPQPAKERIEKHYSLAPARPQ